MSSAVPPNPQSPAELALFYRRYGGVVLRRARRLLGSDQAAQDVCQEVFIRLLRARPNFAEASPVTWLYRVTTNLCLNVMRDERRRRRGERGAPAPSPPALQLSLSLLLQGIAPPLHELAVYYYVDQMSQDEIALVLGVSQRTVSSRLREFRGALQSAWGMHGARAAEVENGATRAAAKESP
jgi:RNA polymerase sigma-70 factor (ECF subfamily)